MILAGLEIDAERVRATVRINDVPVAAVGGPGGGRAFLPATPFIVRGENWLSVDTTPYPAEGEAAPRLVARIAVFEEGDAYFTDAGRQLARVEGGGGAAPLGRAPFQADFGPGSWSWMRCRVWPSAEAALADAVPFVQEMLEAFARSDAGWFGDVSAHKFADSAQAFPTLKRAVIERIAGEEVAALPASAVPRVTPIPVLCGDGRLLQLQSAGGEPLAMKPDGDGNFATLSAIVGKLDGRWLIFR